MRSAANHLEDEVKIIEEEVEKCKNYESFECIDDYIEHLRNKINQLIDVINDMGDKE